MTTSVVHAERPTGALALASDQNDWTSGQRAALGQLGLSDASPADLKVFLHQAQRTGLDPFARQIYMIGRWDKSIGGKKYTIQASIDGLRIVAERSGQYGGQDGPYWCGPDGQWVDIWVSDKPPVAAKIGVRRRDWSEPTYAVAKFSEYSGKNKDGSLTQMWANKPCVMIAKCAEALALRKAFPQDLSGIYTSDEMAQDVDGPPLRMVIDQVPEEDQPEVDWDARVKACGSDLAALRELYPGAPVDVKKKIIARVEEINTAAKGPAAPEPEVVDAEIVETVEDIVDRLIECRNFSEAEEVRKRGQSDDVKAFVDDEVAEAVGVDKSRSLRLDDFAKAVGTYIRKHNSSVLRGVDPTMEAA